MNQSTFFADIRQMSGIPKDKEFKSFIAQLLDISESGAYKKIKGITHLTIDEAHQICERLGCEVRLTNQLEVLGSEPFIFHCDDIISTPATYEQWASNILNHSLNLDKFKPDYKIWSYQREISYFHLLPFRFLLYFKLFAWNRSSWQIPAGSKFDISEFSRNHALNSLLDKIYNHFISYDGIEIWHVDFLNGILNQINYFYQLGIFKRKEDLKDVLKDVRKLVVHLQSMAELNQKKEFGKKENGASFNVFLNYTHTSSSLMLIKAPQFRMIYNLYLHPNYIRTTDEHVCEYTERWIQKIINQSELISGSGEVARVTFFRSISDKIDKLELDLDLV